MGVRRRAGISSLAALVLVAVVAGAAAAQGTVSDVGVALTVEIGDPVAWHALYQEVLATPGDAPKPLGLSVAGPTGGDRWLSVGHPVLLTQVPLSGAARILKVTVTGKIAGPEALRGLVAFEQAVIAMQAGVLENRLTFMYGLSSVAARLLDWQVTHQ